MRRAQGLTLCLLSVAVLLASCAPSLSAVSTVRATADALARDPARVLITAAGVEVYNGGLEPMTGDPSRPRDRLTVVLTARGPFAPTTPAPGSCESAERPGYFVCYLPSVPPSGSAAIASPGGQVVSCTALYYRPSRGAYLFAKPCKLGSG